MEIENLSKITLSGVSIIIGTLFGVLRSKIFATKHETKLYILFYAISVLVIIFSIALLQGHWSELIEKKLYFEIGSGLVAIVSAAGLILVTYKLFES